MNMVKGIKIAKTVGTIATSTNPATVLVRIGVEIATSLIIDAASKKIMEKIEESKAKN